MKHLPIGKLIEKKKNGKTFYRLNLFNGHIVKDFDHTGDALELIAHHCETLINEKSLLTDVYVLVKHLDGRKHYLLMDANWQHGGKLGEINVFEETQFEYISSHTAFKKLYTRRRKINERKYDFNDILRSGINWSPWFTRIFGLLLGLLFFVGASCLISFLDYASDRSHASPLTDKEKMWLNLGVWFSVASTFVVPIVHFLTFYINKKMLKDNDFEYGRLNWRTWYFWRKNTMRFCLVSYAITLYFDIDLLLSVWDKTEQKDILVKYNFLIVSVLFALAIITVGYILIWTSGIKLFYNMRVYLTKDERLFFWRWYFGKTKQMLVKVDYNFFLLDPEDTAYIAKKEIEETTEIVARLTKKDIKDYKRKSFHSHTHGIKLYKTMVKQDNGKKIKNKH